jgi:1,5-anhydro-D-fructose reductase (1,5-anhydro-D-mannitol-forming)
MSLDAPSPASYLYTNFGQDKRKRSDSLPLGFGVVGAGGFGQLAARAVAEAPGAELRAVFRRTIEGAREVVAGTGANAYDEVDQLLADEGVQAVWIATPNALHAEQTLLALEAGKHVLVEKPMALELEDARAMAALAGKRGLVLGVGFHLRHHALLRATREAFATGAAGEPVLARALWGSVLAEPRREMWQLDPELAGAGSLGGLGIHLLDLVPWLVGRRVVEVAAQTDGPSAKRRVEFLASVLLRLEGDCFAQLVSSRRLPHAHNDLVVYGSKARVACVGALGMGGGGMLQTEPQLSLVPQDSVDPYRAEVVAFCRAVEGGPKFEASASDGVRSVQLWRAVLESASSGRSVAIEENEAWRS